ncbi:MAG: hypothetical protein AAF942_00385 [Pseudomonadota bacterium]
MARMKQTAKTKGSVLFDIVYEDGTLSSNRKVPAELLDGLDGDDPARGYIEAQDRDIAEKSGRPRGRIKTIVRTPRKKSA